MSERESALFLPAIFVGGLVFGLGLAISGMARPEVVLDFLQFEDFGLLFVMGGAAVVTGLAFFLATTFLDRAPLTATEYTRRVKEFDRNVVVGGVIFGVGWGLSGICRALPTRVSVSGTSPSSGRSQGCSSVRTRKATSAVASRTPPTNHPCFNTSPSHPHASRIV